MKHNKKRNTAFLYECLMKELTKAIIKKDETRKQNILKIVKENFYKNSLLRQDLEIYRSILESEKMSREFAEKFLVETKKDFASLDRKQIFNLQTNLIKQINESLSSEAFANFISNYKNIASVGAYFNSNLKAKNRLLIENRIVGILSSNTKNKEQKMVHIDNLTYKTFINKFNESYKNTLQPEQKELLMNYIVSFSDNGLGLKSFINEEISRLKDEVYKCTKKKKIVENSTFLAKTEQVLKKLDSFSKIDINEQMVKDIFYIQNLVLEINS